MSIYRTYLSKCAQTTPFLHLIVVPNLEITVSTHTVNAILILLRDLVHFLEMHSFLEIPMSMIAPSQ